MIAASWRLPLVVAVVLVAAAGSWSIPSAQATTGYNNPGPFVTPLLTPTSMPGLPTPAQVPGKEYTSDVDSTTTGAADPGQVIAWDGLGGTADWLDYTGTRPRYASDDDVDALANFYDTLVGETLADSAHLIFSVDDSITLYNAGTPTQGTYVPSAGPVYLSNGNQIGGAGELSYELAGAFPLQEGQRPQYVWADQASINDAEPYVTDIDALELWGPEPAFSYDERNKYSLEADYSSYDTAIPGDAVSVWNHSGTPFIAHSMIVDVVEALLGTPANPELNYVAEIDVDALMVLAINGSPYSFDPDMGTGTDDIILFSICQIADPLDVDNQGYYATGSEVFWLDASGDYGFLHHGGHDWDRDYALASLVFSTSNGAGVVDINVLEAVTVPEATSVILVLLGIPGLRLLGPRRSLPA